jgi:hypothetical protein
LFRGAAKRRACFAPARAHRTSKRRHVSTNTFFKCASPAAAIERAKGFWQILGHAGAVAFVRVGHPESTTTVLRAFGNVPGDLLRS